MKNNRQDIDQADPLQSVAQAAERLGVSRTFLYREVAAFRISFFRLRGQIRISNAALNDYLERHHTRSIETTKPKRNHF